ncbi:MAG TPA: tRNA (adenosine(37)-N6)-threonylcarbamoyltransferase complex dimerization subunit type 1 TsaB [Bacteroidales bacterium]|nr:tRNA (adenosine(37)-N6)-threonylcarbamoyltransferase complex dimerization subunit type 1 TsaB [Bacteroidales bacterium]
MIFLLIETSSQVCSIAIANENKIIKISEENTGLKHAALAPKFAKDILENYKPDAVVLSAGPGSYTGLRIGTSLAKGICYGLDIPLIGVSTLLAMTNGLQGKQTFPSDSLFVPMLDARRMEVYTAVYDNKDNEILPVQPMILNEESFQVFSEKRLIMFGSGSDKAKTLFTKNQHIHFVDNFSLSAQYLLHQAIRKYKQNKFEDISYFEPLYLKAFHITTSKKKLF